FDAKGLDAFARRHSRDPHHGMAITQATCRRPSGPAKWPKPRQSLSLSSIGDRERAPGRPRYFEDLRHFRGTTTDPELLHPAPQGTRVHVQHARGALGPVDAPAGPLENREDVL